MTLILLDPASAMVGKVGASIMQQLQDVISDGAEEVGGVTPPLAVGDIERFGKFMHMSMHNLFPWSLL